MCRWSSLVLPGLLLLVNAAGAQLTADKAEGSFKVVDGLEFKLWASEPLFVNPTCMDVDHLGRVWVCESVNYRNKLRRLPRLHRPEGDRIVILSDKKGTGKADTATTFYQHPSVLAPLGIAVAKDPAGKGWKVFICQSPDILVLEDKDGDGKADGPPKKLLTGFRGIDHDHGVHGILIGPDMKLYFSVGDQGVGGLQSSDGKGRKWTSNSTDVRAGTIWRCDLDGKNLELIAHNFRNEYEPCVDSFGTVFVSDNDDDGNQQTRICHVMPGGNYGYHASPRKVSHWNEELPGVVHKILRTGFGSPTGMCVYEGKLLPKKYRGQPLHTDAGPRQVRAYLTKPDGASYSVEREDMVTSTDTWFRPSDVCVAPDGSAFVADWYDPGVGGHNIQDWGTGRIYRLAPKGSKYTVPKVDLDSDKGILTALASPTLSVRYMAMAKIGGMKPEEVVKLLGPVALQNENPVLRARALWQLARLTGRSEATLAGLKAAQEDKDPRFQVLAIRLGKDFLTAPGNGLALLASQKVKAKADSSVLRECLIALRDVNPDDAKEAIYDLMKLYAGKDRFYLSAIGIAVGQLDEKRREAILGDFAKHFKDIDDKTIELIWELRPPVMLDKLISALADDKTPAARRVRIADTLGNYPDKAGGEALVAFIASDAPADARNVAMKALFLHLPGKWSALRNSEVMGKTIAALLSKPATRTIGLDLLVAAGRTDRVKDVLAFAKSKDEPVAIRKAAIAALGKMPSKATSEALGELLRDGPADLRSDVTRSLGELAKGDGVARKALQAIVTDDKADAALREAAVSALSAGRPGCIWLLDLKAKNKLATSLVSITGRVLRNSPYGDLRRRAVVAFPPPGKLDPKQLPSIKKLVARKGDVARGKAILAASTKSNLQCLKCHTIQGFGGTIGPDLSMIGKKASRQDMYESILFPNKAIADQFATWLVETNKGLLISGLLVEETPQVVVLRDAEGRDTRISKKTIEKKTKSMTSLMPEDLLRHMSEDELVDVVEYLLTLKTASLSIDTWHIIGPFENGIGMQGLDKVFPPEKVIDLKATYAGKSGKVGWKTVKAGLGGYFDLMSHFGPNSANIVSYLTAEIESPASQDATVLLGTDDGAKLWVNGKLVHTTKMTRAAMPGQDTVKVKLTKGKNTLLLKINNGSGPHGFYFTLLSEQELKMAGKK